MRQLKGKPKKESWKDKKERKQAMQEAREQVTTIVLPTLAVLVLFVVFFVYVATRPGSTESKRLSRPAAFVLVSAGTMLALNAFTGFQFYAKATDMQQTQADPGSEPDLKSLCSDLQSQYK